MRSILLAFTIIVLGSAHAAAQVGGIAGTVKDSSGAVLRGARVQVEQGPSGTPLTNSRTSRRKAPLAAAIERGKGHQSDSSSCT